MFLNKELDTFLKLGLFNDKSIPIGSSISSIISHIFLFRIEKELNKKHIPFLRWTDDFLLFFKDKDDIEETLKNIINPSLKNLKLNISVLKTKSGKVNVDKISFIGFDYIGGIFKISEKKIENFKNDITKITALNSKNNNTETLIKKINQKINGFGHYYKIAKCKNDYLKLDAFVRQRVRRKMNHHRDRLNKKANLIIKNESLDKLNLKRLESINKVFAQKNGQIKWKSVKNSQCDGKINLKKLVLKTKENNKDYINMVILTELNELSVRLEKIERMVKEISERLTDK